MSFNRSWYLAALVAGCAGLKGMAVPPDVARDMAPVAVTNRSSWTGALVDESFVMGQYRISGVDRKWNSSSGWNMGPGVQNGASSKTSKGGYAYTFTVPAGQIRAECATQLARDEVRVAGWSKEDNTSRVGCRCVGAGMHVEAVVQGPEAAWQGQVNLPNQPPALMRAIDRYPNGVHSETPLGFEVRGPQAALGAVELARPGKVWLSGNLDPQGHAALACLFAGMLLFESPKTSS
jgi:hypothetical protein